MLHGWDISLSGVVSLGKIQDHQGWTISNTMPGVRVRLSKEAADFLSVGIEGEGLWAADCRSEFLTKMEKYTVSGLVKWVLTPEVAAQVYVLLSGGMTFDRASWNFSSINLNQRSAVWGVGMGINTHLGKRILLEAEYRVSYEKTPWNNFLMKTDSSIRHEAAVGLGWLF